MSAPVAITDPALLERLALADDAFVDHFLALIANLPSREWTPERFERGLRYPWYRPERSYLLRDGRPELLHELDPRERTRVVERHAGAGSGRVSLLAFGSNAAARNLQIKIEHHTEPADREVLVLAGALHELDVVATAAVAAYGALPATLAPSPGTAVRAALLRVTAAQLTTLTWGEMPYRLGRLHGAPFVVEDGVEGLELGAPLAFISRWGAFAPDGVPIALAAVPAAGRRFPAATQRELVDRVAHIALGPDAGGAEALTRLICADTSATARRTLPALRPHALPFDFPGWTPLAPDGTLPPG